MVRYPYITRYCEATGRAIHKTKFISRQHILKHPNYTPDLAVTKQKCIEEIANFNKFQPVEIFPIACKTCVGCRVYQSQQWGIRATHEAQMHEDNCFLTLTYDPLYLPKDGCLVKKDMQNFFKRLRKNLKTKFRYLYCGEYGTQNGRPHYHALLFGLDFKDKQFHHYSASNHPEFTSETLTRIWGKGICTIGSMTYQSACYVGRYATKKVNGISKEAWYAIVDENGEVITDENNVIYQKPQEFAHSSTGKEHEDSLGGGLGARWYEKYHTDVFPKDEVVIEGTKKIVPNYYDKLLQIQNYPLFEQIKAKRLEDQVWRQMEKPEEYSHKRLLQKEQVKNAQLTQRLQRTI